MGSILAPNATITANVNVDGNIIANIVNIKGGESHKWDIHPVEEFVQPTDPQPTDPQPTDPQPTDPVIIPPTTDDEFAGETNPGKPSDSDTPQPEPTPDKDPVPSTPESATPAKPDGSHQSQPVKLTSQDPVVVDTPSSQFQIVAAPASAIAKAEDKAVALPQTGTDNHGILLGIALAITAQLMIGGLVQPKKKKK